MIIQRETEKEDEHVKGEKKREKRTRKEKRGKEKKRRGPVMVAV